MKSVADHMKMRSSRVLSKLRSGQCACSVKTNISNVNATEVAAMSGFDCIWTDMEHVANDWSAIERQVMVSKIYDTDIIVRVARGSYSDYIRPLEADATGIMVPHVMSVQDAQNIVRSTRFHPLGLRPVDGGNADGKYCAMDYDEYTSTSNREKVVILQIEDPQPLEELEAICELEGFDIIFFGPGDFSQSIGYPGQVLHPEVIRARKRIAEAARRHNKFAGTVAVGNISELIDEGYQLINIAADVIALNKFYSKVIEDFRALTQ